jgi:DNA-directed RNA polymerase specialized sigma24 family protein
VTMFYFSRMSSHQIAEATGETDANVRSTLSRAREQLRDMLFKHKKQQK